MMAEHPEQPPAEPIFQLASACQAWYAAWHNSAGDEQQAAIAAWQRACEALLEALQSDLQRLARRWRRSIAAADDMSLLLNLFAGLIEALPTLKLDANRNVRSLLLLVAHRRSVDAYRRDQNDAGVPRKPINSSGPNLAAMWPTLAVSLCVPHDEPVDTSSYDHEQRIIDRLDRQALLAAVWSYWPAKLKQNDLLIMQLRWLSDPPSSFGAIAQALGHGWEEDTVRQRHHRILKQTRSYLQSQGFIEGFAE